ncbi:MAG: type II toxin-antitoxin system RelE/ParE family toxin [Bacteroidales bacterium]|nr:type II toxin-antitoxin system RelE/ParE family toxin [Bacteroidales bacterium]
MVQVIWTPLAQEDVEDIFNYYNSISNRVAQAVAEEIFDAANHLETMPEMGTIEPTFAHLHRNYRYLVVLRRYKLIYLYENQVSSILMVWDCRQNPELLKHNDRFSSIP